MTDSRGKLGTDIRGYQINMAYAALNDALKKSKVLSDDDLTTMAKQCGLPFELLKQLYLLRNKY
ncbi:MAG: hypothetical protein M0Z67_04295 [Nitrospiraceae bacterium]|nr:hypothetical protein [Nitrospiraceae bacterium]